MRLPCLLRRGLAVALLALAACHGREPPLIATVLPTPLPLPALTLAGSDGAPFPLQRLAGHPTLLFLGYSSCEDICPTTLTTLAAATRTLDAVATARRPRILFLSVDPQRDGPERLAAYVQHFGTNVDGASARPSELKPLLAALGATAEVPADADPARGYTVSHSSTVYLLDSHARLAAVFTPPFDAAALTTDLTRLLARGGDIE